MKTLLTRYKSSSLKEFAVLLYSRDTVRGCFFRKKGSSFALQSYGKHPLDPENPSEGFRQLKKTLGYSASTILVLSGAMPGENFFFRTVLPEMPVSATKQALTLELPRVMPGVNTEEEFLFEFVPAGRYGEEESEVRMNVLAFTGKGLDSLCSMISQSLRKVDYYVHPLLPLRLTDGPLYLPEAEEDFFFADGLFHDKEQWKDDFYRPWEESLSKLFILPEEPPFSIREYLGCLLVGRFAASGDFALRSKAIQILPSKLRPGRLRNQLRITAVLLILLCGGLLWEYGGEFLKESRSISALEREKRSLNTRVRKLKQQLKAGEKERKELQRLLQQKAGTTQILEKLAALSSVLPTNVMVQSLRWTDSAVDLTLRSEAENLNLPALFRSLPHWKITQMQERRRNNDAASTITLKLTPKTPEDPE